MGGFTLLFILIGPLQIQLLNAFLSELLCVLCIECAEDSKEELVRRNNCHVLKNRIVVEDTLDDSFHDPDYLDKNKYESSDEDSDIYKFHDETDFVNPFETIKMPDPVVEVSEFVNPFVKLDNKDDFVNPFEREGSSTIQSEKSNFNFNPFASSSPKNVADAKGEKVCPHCDKIFPSNYNLKQHLISIHKIFPEGLTIYKCDDKGCNFVTGSRAMFSRHSQAKFVQPCHRNTKPMCPVCHQQFCNPSSLKRHVIRKGH